MLPEIGMTPAELEIIEEFEKKFKNSMVWDLSIQEEYMIQR